MNHEEVAHIIPTFERPRVCQRLIDSIRAYYPSANIYVCDDSRTPHRYDGAHNIPAPAYDIGLSAKRNHLVDATDEPYILLHDDDYIFTDNSDLSVMWDLFHEFDEVGIVCGERRDSRFHFRRAGWFCGKVWPEASVRYHRPPDEQYQTVTVGGRTLRYHPVDFAMNWYLADRRTVELVPWDEELKLQEHIEHFSRLAAVRAQHHPDERSLAWRDRYQVRSTGEVQRRDTGDDRVWVFAKATFANKQHLSHLDGNVAHQGNWYRVDPDYASELRDLGVIAEEVDMRLARPFPLPDNPAPGEAGHAPCHVLLALDVTCLHSRDMTDTFESMRTRDEFWTLKQQKLGTVETDIVQWNDHPRMPTDPFQDTITDEMLSLPTLE
jgi:hypothetical protein